jgi:hypothetical protein
MERKYKWLGIGLAMLLVGHYLQLVGLHMAASHEADHATAQGQARLQSRVGRSYWVRPNANSTYQFVRFGDENTADSITRGIAVKDTEKFTVSQLSVRPNSDSGTYQVRFDNGTLKWIDDSAFKIHLYVPGIKMKLTPEIFEEDPHAIDARLKGQLGPGRYLSLGPNPEKPSNVSFGMTEEQVQASDWGRPNRVITQQTPTGTDDIWMYGGNFLSFRNGHLEEVLNDM